MYRRLSSLQGVENSQTSADWTVYGTSDLCDANPVDTHSRQKSSGSTSINLLDFECRREEGGRSSCRLVSWDKTSQRSLPRPQVEPMAGRKLSCTVVRFRTHLPGSLLQCHA